MQTKCIILTEKGRKGKVLQSQVLDFNMEEYYVIPLQPDDRVYNRTRVKEETRKKIERYYEEEER